MTDPAAIEAFWRRAARTLGLPDRAPTPPAWHFCDNRADADECLGLVLSGDKTATAPSVAELTLAGDPLPRPGDLDIVTDFAGAPACVIRTVSVAVAPFSEVDADFARAEGEGDKSLGYWRRVHEAYYRRVLSGTEAVFTDDMPIVLQRFEVAYRAGRRSCLHGPAGCPPFVPTRIADRVITDASLVHSGTGLRANGDFSRDNA